MVCEQTCSCGAQNGLKFVTNVWRVWSPTFITHVNSGFFCYLRNTAQQCRLGLFQDSDFAGGFEDSTSTSRGLSCIFGSHTFVPISWMCKRQTSVSHSSTESEIISLDAGWTENPHLIYGIWSSQFSTEVRIRVLKNGETRARARPHKLPTRKKSHGIYFRRGSCVHPEVTRLCQLSWMCKKQTSVSHSSTEAEIISLDAGLRMDGIPALDLWDLVIEMFHSAPNQTNKARDLGELQGNLLQKTPPNIRSQIPNMHINLDLANSDHVSSNVKPSGSGAMLCVFWGQWSRDQDDNQRQKSHIETRVKDPTELLWIGLCDRSNLDPKIQIRYVDTKHQLADILTKGNFTRDEWNNLHHLFNISHFSLLCFSQNFTLTSCSKTMAKRMQEEKGEEIIVAKSKPTTMNLAVSVSTSSSTVQDPVAWWVEQSSSLVQHHPIQLNLLALRISAWLAAPKRWRRGCRNKKKHK